jgi:hypothetical protein
MSWGIFWEAVAFLLLLGPIGWEQWNDRNGDDHSDSADILIRGGLMVSAALMAWLIAGRNFWAALLLSASLHFLIFDYWIAYKLERNDVIKPGSSWFRYVGKSSDFDQESAWVKVGPWGRLIARLAVALPALVFYFA